MKTRKLKEKEHTASYLISRFLLSKRSLKKKYDLNLGSIAILRYICDSIDLNYKSKKSISTKLYQTQIAEYCHCTLKTARKHISHLIKKKFLRFDSKNHTFTLGITFRAWVKFTYGLDIGKNYLWIRCRENLPISNSSYLSNNAHARNVSHSESKAPEETLVQKTARLARGRRSVAEIFKTTGLRRKGKLQ